MKLLFRVAMLGVLLFSMMILGWPVTVKANANECYTTVFCVSNDGSKTGMCGSDCYCHYSDGTKEYDGADCALL